MSMPTLRDLTQMASDLQQLEREAQRSQERAAQLRKCGGYKHIADWLIGRRSGYGNDVDYDGITKLLTEALVEFSPAILEALASRQELAAHEAMTRAVFKRSELGTFVTLEATQGAGS